MFALYLSAYLLKHGLATQKDLEGISSYPYPEFIQKLVEQGICNGVSNEHRDRHCNGHCNSDDIEKLIFDLQNEYNLSQEQLEALKGGELYSIIRSFIYFDADKARKDNIKAYQSDNHLSDEEMEDIIKSGNIEHFIPEYIFDDPQYYNRYISLIFDYLFKYISKSIILKPVTESREYSFEGLSYQRLIGDYHIFLGFAGKGDGLLPLAKAFSKKNFQEVNDAAYESICEIINCINGLYASELSNDNIHLEIAVPGFSTNRTLTSNYLIYCMPLVIDGEEIDMIISFNSDIEII